MQVGRLEHKDNHIGEDNQLVDSQEQVDKQEDSLALEDTPQDRLEQVGSQVAEDKWVEVGTLQVAVLALVEWQLGRGCQLGRPASY